MALAFRTVALLRCRSSAAERRQHRAPRPLCSGRDAHNAQRSADDEARRADVLSRRRRRGRGAVDAPGDSDGDGDGPRSAALGAAAEPSGAAAIEALLLAGVLQRHASGPVSIMRLSVPGVGSVVRCSHSSTIYSVAVASDGCVFGQL